MPSGHIPLASGQATATSSTRLRASSVPRNDMNYRTNYEQYATPIVNNEDPQKRSPVLRKSTRKSELTPAEQYKRQILAREDDTSDRPIPPPKPSTAPQLPPHNFDRIGRPRQRKHPEILQPATFTEQPQQPARLRRETSVHAPQQSKQSKRSQEAAAQRPSLDLPTPQQMQALGYNHSFDSFPKGAGVMRNNTVPANHPALSRRGATPTSPQGFPVLDSPYGHKRGRSDVPNHSTANGGIQQESPTSSYTSAGTSHYATSQTMPIPRPQKRQSSLTRSILSFKPRPRANSDSQGVRPSHVTLQGLTPTTTRSGWPTASSSNKGKDSDAVSSVFSRVRKLSTGSLRAVLPCLSPNTVEDKPYGDSKQPLMTEIHQRFVKSMLPSPPGSATSHETMATKRDRRLSPGGFAEQTLLYQLRDIDLPARRTYEQRTMFEPARPMPQLLKRNN